MRLGKNHLVTLFVCLLAIVSYIPSALACSPRFKEMGWISPPREAKDIPRNAIIWLTLYSGEEKAPKGWLEDQDGNKVELNVSGKEAFMYQPNKPLKANATYKFHCKVCFGDRTGEEENCHPCQHDNTRFTTSSALETSAPTYNESNDLKHSRAPVINMSMCGASGGTHFLTVKGKSDPKIAWYELTKLTKDGKDHSETHTNSVADFSLSFGANRSGEKVCYQLDAISYTGKVIPGDKPICQTLDNFVGMGCNQTQGISKNPTSLLWSLLVFALLFGFRRKAKRS